MAQTSLTGAFNTGQLTKITDAPVTVTVSRTPLPGHDAAFEAWTERAVAMLRCFPGSLGVGVLRPATAGGEWHIVFRFVDALALRNWDRSPQRAALIADADQIASPMRVQRTVGADNWFALPERAAPPRRLVHKVVEDALWVYPLALVMTVFIAPRLPSMALSLRVLVSGLLSGVASQVTIVPMRRRLRRRRFG